MRSARWRFFAWTLVRSSPAADTMTTGARAEVSVPTVSGMAAPTVHSSAATAPVSGRIARLMSSARARVLLVVLLLLAPPGAPAATSARVDAVDAIAITVSDIDRAADFYARVLGFETLSDHRIAGPEWSALFALPDGRARVVTMKLGDERVELTAFGARGGRTRGAEEDTPELQ